MAPCDLIGDPAGRDLIWLTVLGQVMNGPLPLGILVSRIEGVVLDELDGTPRNIAAGLIEMDRGCHIQLRNDGRRWSVTLGPKGRETFRSLMQAGPAPDWPPIKQAAGRIRARLAPLMDQFSISPMADCR